MDRENSFALRFPPFLLLCFSFAFTFAGAGALQQFVVPVLRQRGWTEFKSYLPLIVIYFSFALFRFLSGFPVKRLGLRASLLLGSLTYALFPLAFLLKFPYPLLLFVMFLWGLGAAIYWTAGTVATLGFSKKERYGSYSGLLYTFLNVGFAIGIGILGFINTLKGEIEMYLFAFSLSLLGSLLLIILPSPSLEMDTLPPKELLKLALGKASRPAGFYLFVSALALGIMFGSFGEWITSRYGFAYLTIITFIGYAGRIFLAYPGGYISDKWGENIALMLSFLISALGLGLTLAFTSPFTFAFAALTLGSQMSIVPIVATSLIGKRFPPHLYHFASGAILAWNSLGVAIALILGASLQSIWKSLPSVLFVFALLFAICGIFSLRKEEHSYAD